MPDVHVLGGRRASATIEQVAHVIQRFGVGVIDVEAEAVPIGFSQRQLQRVIVGIEAVVAEVVGTDVGVDAIVRDTGDFTSVEGVDVKQANQLMAKISDIFRFEYIPAGKLPLHSQVRLLVV